MDDLVAPQQPPQRAHKKHISALHNLETWLVG